MDLPDLPGALWALIRQVPAGRVTTYGALAEALGNRVAARWVGHVALHHPHQSGCPCHRLVRADGALGDYIAGPAAKRRLLAAEGVPLARGAVDLARYGFTQFTGQRPLERLTQLQAAMAKQVSLRGLRRIPRLVGGLDVSYAGDEGVGAYAAVAWSTGELVYTTTVRRAVGFPYISSYLTFRELPILLALLEAARAAGKLAEVVLVDGSGILHPRRIGVASAAGVAADWPTIGVTKKLLCGRVELAGMAPREPRPVLCDDRVLGVAIRATSGSRRPLFVSPGHRIGLPMAQRVVLQMLRGRRLPEPLYWADRLSRQEARRP